MIEKLVASGEPAAARFASPRSPAVALRARTVSWLSLGVCELLAISWLFEIQLQFSLYFSPFYYLRQMVIWALISAAAFLILAWPRRMDLFARWSGEQVLHRFAPALALNLSLFLVLAAATRALTQHAAGLDTPPWGLLAGYTAMLIVTGVALVRVDVGLAGLTRIAGEFRNEIAIAAVVGLSVILFSVITTFGWEYLASGTLYLAQAILELYETDVAVNDVERVLRVGQFEVLITQNCSGYEGIALVAGFLCVYMWVFRETLRFPRAFLLFPIGIAFIWLLNSVRIALLTSLGAHVSPEIASQGFHSQAGWIAFLVATVALMALAQSVTYFQVGGAAAADAPAPADASATSDRAMLGYLAPFMALMAASMLLAAAVPYDRAIYGLKVAAVLAALWLFRDVWRGARWTVSPEAVIAGLLVGVAWIATDPAAAAASPLGAWLASQGTGVAVLWLLVRVIGSGITVPIAEELAFRGMLARWIIGRDFTAVDYARLTLPAMAISSVLFGLMHERWIAGALAGLVFALVAQRTRSLAGAVVAHMAANLVICAWALVFRQWSLL